MSRILNCEVAENCKPWRAPNLDEGNNNNYDFKLVNPDKSAIVNNRKKSASNPMKKVMQKDTWKGWLRVKVKFSIR